LSYQRADYQTLSRRAHEEKVKASQFAISKFASSLLQTSDILNQALAYVPQPIDAEAQPALKALFDGVSLTNKTLIKTLAEYGVEKFESLGERFDPNRHEALYQVPKAALNGKKGPKGEELEAGVVMDVSVEGWQIKDRVLRPAQVGVVQSD
jgi:molecular chaperone GrpE